MNIGEIITDFLARSGMSQADLARETGIPETTISRLKTAKSCNLSTWAALSRVIKPEISFMEGPGDAA